jgi:ribosomal protein S18 acetylase RimI-like enzyme
MERVALPPFPRNTPAPAAPALEQAGLRLRPASSGDLAFLKQLYAAWRLPELLTIPWTAVAKQDFLDDQFRLQHSHYVRHFARADFWLVSDLADRPIGQLYLDRSGTDWRLIEILLAADSRRQGHGSRLIRWIQDEAAAAGKNVSLLVAANNPAARALYLRLGFVEITPDTPEIFHSMEWRPGIA